MQTVIDTQPKVETILTPLQQKQTPLAIGNFGNGRYSALAKECFDGAKQVFGLDETKADKLARIITTDFGAIMAANTRMELAGLKVGKLSKDGKLTLTEAASKVKGVTMTDSIHALMALKYASDAGKNGFLWGKTQWAVTDLLTRYFAGL